MSRIFPPGDLKAAIAEFTEALPNWWFSVGSCERSADATIAPTELSQDHALIDKTDPANDPFNVGFDFDDRREDATLARSLRIVTAVALAQRARRRTFATEKRAAARK